MSQLDLFETPTSQRLASDPKRSAWVSANAGSGKTTVLAQRVVRLLLAGTDPGAILCLTFTKAAAAEMATRVFRDLAAWTLLDDAALSAKIAELEGRRPDALQLAAARRLFAQALETPGGLKIQTIHAFCEQLLHRFPFEANVPAHFEILDDRLAAQLIADAEGSVFAAAAADPAGILGEALGRVTENTSEGLVRDGIAEFVAKRDRLRRWLGEAGDLKGAGKVLRRHLGLKAGETVDALRRDILDGSLVPASDWRALRTAMAASGKQDRAASFHLARMLDDPRPAERVEGVYEFFFTEKGRGDPRKTFVTGAVLKRFPGLEDSLNTECRRVEALREKSKAADCVETSVAMLTLADAAIAAYEREKIRRGVVDFEDLIVKAANLLTREAAREWVHYKLDRGLDHILVDEAQDTSPRQWQVIEQLAEEFFSGVGARRGPRTIFAVGDEKQSIYSFQGAAPAEFGAKRTKFRKLASGAGMAFEDVKLRVSFRSTPQVLSAVDTMFAAPEIHAGLSSDASALIHEASRRRDVGEVVVWAPFEPVEREAPADWAAPLDQVKATSPEAMLAERIARTIREWVDAGKASVRAGGILILTRKRDVLHGAINRALKKAGVPVAGADRLALLEHIAVMDLMALGQVMLLPEDDLSLAALLRSPLFGLGEEELFDLAQPRTGTLWRALEEAVSPRLAGIRQKLEAWRARADFLAPFDFYARILGADGGRKAFAARLGVEAEEVLDEFLAEALAYERSEPPSLQGFLAWLGDAETEVKRDPAAPRDEVRVMTVHGAKGLEADTVFIVDDGSAMHHPSHDARLVVLGADDDPAAPLAWYRSAPNAPQDVKQRVSDKRLRHVEEYRRLLYVAATRARDRLVVTGIIRSRTDAAGWHGLIRTTLEPTARAFSAEEAGVDGFRWPATAPAMAAPERPAAEAEAVREPMPAWYGRAPSPASLAARLRPSQAVEETGPPFPARRTLMARLRPEDSAALERGRAVHRLLQALPGLAPETRREAGARYLAAAAPAWTEAERQAALAGVLAILEESRFAAVFSPGSRAEVALSGRIESPRGPLLVSGRVDRLAVTPERVMIVDYKTNRPAPMELSDVPRSYVAQLAIYRRILGELYPGREVAAALLWTEIPQLMELPAETLDKNIAGMLEGRLAVGPVGS